MYVCVQYGAFFFVLLLFSVPTLVMFLLCAKEFDFTACAVLKHGSHNIKEICPRDETVTTTRICDFVVLRLNTKKKLQCFSRYINGTSSIDSSFQSSVYHFNANKF